eukprot:86413-Rhodomonas_salina.6
MFNTVAGLTALQCIAAWLWRAAWGVSQARSEAEEEREARAALPPPRRSSSAAGAADVGSCGGGRKRAGRPCHVTAT